MTQQEWDQAWAIYDSCIDGGGVPAHCEGAAQASFPDFSANQNGGSAIGQYFGNPGNWASFAGGITDVVGDIVGIANGRPNYGGNYGYQPTQNNTTIWWIAGGIAILFLILLLVIAFKK
ncbi:hypothetical protein [Aureispira anguillae]|uniref:Uncharacterized protein n=1 Tax=Aureispira anguillae TaxID=2864201 RepID=A0A916DRB0_9BACT|nr:hypothetical protein [Aureispira anguillae]BDS10106.1 hypothetical protein AsAng_0008130 [Aureispira anguillae]